MTICHAAYPVAVPDRRTPIPSTSVYEAMTTPVATANKGPRAPAVSRPATNAPSAHTTSATPRSCGMASRSPSTAIENAVTSTGAVPRASG